MDKLTFSTQLKLGLGILAVGFVLSTVFRQGLFTNIAWGLYGVLFVIHPVFPIRVTPRKRDLLLLRLAGLLVVALACITKFGV